MIVKYIQQPDKSWDEVTDFKDRVKNSDLAQARVILDLKDQKVIKNSLNPEASFEVMIEMYKRLIGEKLLPYLNNV